MRATNNAAFAALKVDPRDEIVVLFIDSGGGSEIMDKNGKITDHMENGKRVHDVPLDPKERVSAIAPLLASPDDAVVCPFLVFLKDAKGLDKLFGFALKHLAPNGKVIADGCDALSDAKSDWDKLKLMEIFMENFQIKSGYLFLSSGFEEEANMYPAATDKNASGLAKIRDKFVYLAANITQPFSNQGILGEKQTRPGGVYYAIYKDRLDKTQTYDGPPPNTKPLMEEFIPDALPPSSGPLVDTKQFMTNAVNLAQTLP